MKKSSLFFLIASLPVLTATAEQAATEVPETPRYSFLKPVGDFARDSILEPKVPFELVPGKSANDWAFVLQPYAWAIGLNGDVGVKGLPASHVDYSSRTILEHLDWGIFLRGEIRKGRWGVLADGYYAALSASANPDNRIYDNVNLDLQQSIVSLALAYRVIDDRRGFLDLYAGVRYNYLGLQVDASLNESRINQIGANAANAIGNRIATRLESDPDLRKLFRDEIIVRAIQTKAVRRAIADFAQASNAARDSRATGTARASLEAAAAEAKKKLGEAIAKEIEKETPTYASGDQYWFDPIIGLRGQINFTRWLFLSAQGDVGGFGAGSDIAWNAQAALGVNFTRNIFAELGYRYMYVDYENNGFLYNMNSYGLYSSIGFKF